MWDVFCLNTKKMLPRRGFILKPIFFEYFLNSPPFKRSAGFYVKMAGDFGHFEHFNFEATFLKN